MDKRKRRFPRPRLSPRQVETLHVAAWVLGILDVLLVGISLWSTSAH